MNREELESDGITLKHLPWDSEFFGLKIGELRGLNVAEHQMERCLADVRQNGFDCVYWSPPLTSANSSIAQRFRFLLVDVPHHLSVNSSATAVLGANPGRGECRAATADDLLPAANLARVSHMESRFFRDIHFDPNRSAELYARWVEKCFREPSQELFVVRIGSDFAGYIAASAWANAGENEPASGRIELLAVSPEFQGQGVGRNLLQAALEWLRKKEVVQVHVTTQGANISALRLYQYFGFRTMQVNLKYHYWAK